MFLFSKANAPSAGQGTTRINTSSSQMMLKFSSAFIAVMLHAAVLSGANGADVSDEMAMLVGNTLTAVTWVPHSAAAPGGGALNRFMFQAYLRQNGVALIRVWDAARNAYTRPAERNWGLYGSRLCLDLPAPGPGRICAEVHSWGPRIAGIGTAPYVMLDGDLKPGNALFATR